MSKSINCLALTLLGTLGSLIIAMIPSSIPEVYPSSSTLGVIAARSAGKRSAEFCCNSGAGCIGSLVGTPSGIISSGANLLPRLSILAALPIGTTSPTVARLPKANRVDSSKSFQVSATAPTELLTTSGIFSSFSL